MAIGRLRTPCVARLLALLLLLTLPDAVQAQWNYTTNNGTITITRYTGTNIAVVVPSTTNGLPVTSIGGSAFAGWTGYKGNLLPTTVTLPDTITSIGIRAFDSCSLLPSITIPDSVVDLGENAFNGCSQLTNVILGRNIPRIAGYTFYSCTKLPGITIPDSVSSIGGAAFRYCSQLSNVRLGNSVTNIGAQSFEGCASLTNIAIPASVIYVHGNAFWYCGSLTGVLFQGTPPAIGPSVFYGPGSSNVTVYYLPGTAGWGTNFANRPTVLWNPVIQTGGPDFGVRTNCFGFDITGNTNLPIAVEACTNLANAAWVPLQSCTLTNGSVYFSDPDWTNYPARLYRIRWP